MSEAEVAPPRQTPDLPTQGAPRHAGLDPAVREYHFDVAMVPALAKLIDAACDRVQDMYVVPRRVQEFAPDIRPQMDSATLQEVVDTFNYHLRFAEENPKRFSAELRPFDGETIMPRPLRQAGPEVQQLWAALEGQVTHPIAKARLADIVYSLRLVSDRRAVAARAIRAYLETVGGSLRDRYQAVNLVRAWSIARGMSLRDMEEEAAESMMRLAEATIESDGNPYAALPVLTALTLRRPKGTTPWLGRASVLLDRALTAYMRPDVVAAFADLVRQRAGGDQARIEHASRREVEVILAAADAAQDGLLIRHYLRKVASTGRQLGIIDLAEQAEARLPHLPPVDWTREGMAIEVPESLSGPFLELLEAADTWQELLTRWFDTPVPSGAHESNLKIARHTAAISPLRASFTREVYRAGDLPARTENGEDAVVAEDLVRAEITTAAWQGSLLARGLHMLQYRFGIPSQEHLQGFLIETYNLHPPYARILAKAFQWFWVDEFETSVHLAAPKIEAAARALLLDANAAIYRTEVGDTDGHFLGLGALLPLLCDEGFHPDWERFFRTLLLSDGMNMRNLIAHGFVDEADEVDAALILRACACMLTLPTSASVKYDGARAREVTARPRSDDTPSSEADKTD